MTLTAEDWPTVRAGFHQQAKRGQAGGVGKCGQGSKRGLHFHYSKIMEM